MNTQITPFDYPEYANQENYLLHNTALGAITIGRMDCIKRAQETAQKLNAFPELVRLLTAHMRMSGTIEVLGEWCALDMNSSRQKTNRAKVDALENEISAFLSTIAAQEGKGA